MANHPYIGGTGAIVQAVAHLRRSFPATVTADTLKKLGIAPKNESYLINILKFLTVIDAEGKRTDKTAKVFNLHDGVEFQKAFGQLVKDAYVDLFGLHGETAWALDTDALITFSAKQISRAASSALGRRTLFEHLPRWLATVKRQRLGNELHKEMAVATKKAAENQRRKQKQSRSQRRPRQGRLLHHHWD